MRIIEPLEPRRLFSAIALTAKAESIAGAPEIQLTWSGGKPRESYVIERSFDGCAFHAYARTTTTSYIDTADHLTAEYAYRVIAQGKSSNVASVYQDLTLACFTSEAVYSWNTHKWSVELSWTDSNPAATGFTLERSNDGGAHWQTLTGEIVTTYAAPDSYTKDYFYFDSEVPDGCTLLYGIVEST